MFKGRFNFYLILFWVSILICISSIAGTILYDRLYGANYTIAFLFLIAIGCATALVVCWRWIAAVYAILLVAVLLLDTFVLLISSSYLIAKTSNDKMIRGAELAHIIDRVLFFRGIDNFLEIPIEKFKSVRPGGIVKCKDLLDGDFSSLLDLSYGSCTFWDPVVEEQYDHLWWIDRHHILFEFPQSAYNIPWIRQKVDLIIKNPCLFVFEGESPWNALNCNKNLNQNYATQLILLDGESKAVEKKWFYRHKWEAWLP